MLGLQRGVQPGEDRSWCFSVVCCWVLDAKMDGVGRGGYFVGLVVLVGFEVV